MISKITSTFGCNGYLAEPSSASHTLTITFSESRIAVYRGAVGSIIWKRDVDINNINNVKADNDKGYVRLQSTHMIGFPKPSTPHIYLNLRGVSLQCLNIK